MELEHPEEEPIYDRLLQLSVTPEKAPDVPTYVELDFEKGIPVKLNGEVLSPASLVAKLNEIAGKNGVGIIDILENRVVGMKSRGVYETPGGTILYAAIGELERMCFDKQTLAFKHDFR
jgi:argininosuccinate synthase